MQKLGACAAVVFGTAGERLLSDPSFLPVWDEFDRAKLPLCVHMGMSYPPLAQLGRSIYDGHVMGMSLPAQLAFMAIVGHGMLDRYPDLKVAFLEFGAEWIFYMVSRMDHYLPLDRGAHPFGLSMPNAAELPRASIRDYVKSGRIFMAAEADDQMIHQLFELIGEDHVLFSSDFPTAKAATMPRWKSSNARTSQTGKRENCFTTTPCGCSASRSALRPSQSALLSDLRNSGSQPPMTIHCIITG